MWLIKLLMCLIIWKSSDAVLVRPINVYQNIIASIHDRYKFDSLTLLHGHTDYSPSEDIELTENLVKLQIYFSKLWIPTMVMSMEFFKRQEIPRINQLKKPFFVFLNDYDGLRNQLTPEYLTVVAKSERVSLIFFRDDTKPEEFFKNMYIPFDCQFMVTQRNSNDKNNETISEVYRFTEHGKLQQDVLTSWNPVTGMQLPKIFLHHRRKNFYGHNINVGLIENLPTQIRLKPMDLENNIIGQLMDTMEKDFNFSVTYHKIKYLGDCYENGTCTDAVGKIISKELDITELTTFRDFILNGHVGFSMPCIRTHEYLFFQKKTDFIKWTTHGKLFYPDVWIALGVHILMTSLVIVFMEYKTKAMLLGGRVKKLIPLNLSDIFFQVWTIFNNQSIPYSKYNTIQILQFTTYLLFIIIYAVYSAKLVSFLAADEEEEISFNSLRELLRETNYKVGLTQGSDIYYRLKSMNDSTFFQQYSSDISLTPNFIEGYYRLCQDRKYAFVEFKKLLEFLKSKINNSCEIRHLKSSPHFFTLVLQKNSPLKRYINKILIKMKEHGLPRSLLLPEVKENLYPSLIPAIDILHVFPLLAFLGISILVSIVILLFEIAVHKLKLQQYESVKSRRIWSIINWSSRRIYQLRRRVMKAKYRRGKKRYNRRRCLYVEE